MLLPNQSQLFDIPKNIHYLNCSYMSPSLNSVREAGEEAVRLKSSPWLIKPEDFFKSVQRLKEKFAEIIDSDKMNIALIPSVSYGVETAIKNIQIKKNDKILLLKDQFPSNVYPWMETAKSNGAILNFIEKENDSWTDSVLTAIDSSVKVIAIPNVHWTNGAKLDLKRINKKRKENGAHLILDLTQSCAALPFSVKDIDADFIIAAAYKWLLGPYTLSYLYVSEKFHKGIPLENNWINRKDSENFSNLVNYTGDYGPGAERYDMGEKSNFISVAMANKALDQILEWGVQNISESIKPLTKLINREAENLGLKTVCKQEQSSHMTGVTFEKGISRELLFELREKNVIISVRGNTIRLAPYLYNSEENVQKFINIVKQHL